MDVASVAILAQGVAAAKRPTSGPGLRYRWCAARLRGNREFVLDAMAELEVDTIGSDDCRSDAVVIMSEPGAAREPRGNVEEGAGATKQK